MTALSLPWPPSTNHLYRSIGRGRVLLSKGGRVYINSVAKCVAIRRAGGDRLSFGGQRISVQVLACVPDRRRRDLGNLEKITFDSLTKCGVWNDDCQIDFFSFERGPMVKGGRLDLVISVYKGSA